MQSHDTGRAELAAKVAFLSLPTAYAESTEAPSAVEVVETHMSWVFLTDRYAYKLKKPVRYDFLDYSTVQARRRHCEAEVRLNRRLAATVYLGIAALTRAAGRFRLHRPAESPGTPRGMTDWLVVMRRLPRELMLDYQIAHGTVQQAAMHEVALVLARFYERADRAEWSPSEYRSRLEAEVAANRRALGAPAYGFSARRLDALASAQLDLLHAAPALFDGRVRARRIVDAHGDLRPEHVCLESEPVIIDCLEFKRDLRLLDAASELAFLALECQLRGATALGEQLLATYACLTGDRPPHLLVNFYKSHHACTRAAIALHHLDEPGVRAPEVWLRKARSYLALAARFTALSPRTAR